MTPCNAQQLHTKAYNILEMINEMDVRIEDSKERLLRYDRSSPFDTVCLFYSREEIVETINQNRQTKLRLLNYYENTLFLLVMDSPKSNIFNHLN